MSGTSRPGGSVSGAAATAPRQRATDGCTISKLLIASQLNSPPAYLAVLWGLLFAISGFGGDAREAAAHPVQSDDIRIDGILDEPVWREHPSIGEFVQVEPQEGAPPTEPTQIRLLYDEDTLYIGIFCHDSSPETILATKMSRDARLFSDDNIEILLDTFHDGRNAYFFQTNPNGAMVDGRITENSFPNIEWDGIWLVRAAVVDDGWTAEFAIPFKTLAFRPGDNSWGFNASRRLARIREESRWASASLDIRFTQVSRAGSIEGLQGLSQGAGLDIKPYGLLGYTRDAEAQDQSRILANAGVDIFYRVTNNLISSTTVNTDFAETEVDTRQVNLTRFSLFFPEKRAFFLEDAGVFEFGILDGGGGGRRRAPDLIPFFSRRIGLVEDEVIPLRFGQKLTGKVGRFDVGALYTMTGETDTLGRQNLFIARTKANFLRESYVGAIVTHGDPTGEADNSLIGVDLKLATSNLWNTGKILRMTAYGTKTQTPGLEGRDTAYGFETSYPNDFFDASYQWQTVGENYNPMLGHVRRAGVRKNSVRTNVNPRPEIWNIRQVRIGFELTHFYNLVHQATETRALEITPFRFELNDGQRFQYEVQPSFERLFEPFEIRDDIAIPTGDYSFTMHRLSYRTASNRMWQFDADYQFGSFFGGDSKELSTEFEWGNAHISTQFELQQYWVRLQQGDFNTRLALFRFDYSFNPLMTLSNNIQYDTDSGNIGVQSRLRWIIKPGNEVFLVLNHSWQESVLNRFEPLQTDIRAKLNYTFRF